MAASPLVTIGLPTFNSARYLPQSLESLLGQTYQNFVLIISDNASEDGTEEICRDFASRDPRIRYHRNPVNIGNPGNFNQIARMTGTAYLKWATADDFWAPTFIERALTVMEADPTIVVCYPQAYIVDAEGKNPVPYDDVLHLMQEDPVERYVQLLSKIKLAHQHLGLLRMEALRRTHLLGKHVGSDINLLAELSLFGKFYELPERLFSRRMHPESGSWKRTDVDHQARRYLAADAHGFAWKKWPASRDFFIAVSTAPLPTAAKLKLYRFLIRRVYWQRRELWEELVESVHRGVTSESIPAQKLPDGNR